MEEISLETQDLPSYKQGEIKEVYSNISIVENIGKEKHDNANLELKVPEKEQNEGLN